MVLVIISAYQFAGFPYDNVCDTQIKAAPTYIGNFTIQIGSGTKNFETIYVERGASAYKFCNMDQMWSLDPSTFPPSTSMQNAADTDEWMTDTQGNIVNLIGYYGLGLIIVVGGTKALSAIFTKFKGLFFGLYEDNGFLKEETPFSKIEGDSGAYVPQIRDPDFIFPLIAVDVKDIPQKYIGWQGEEGDHEFFNLMNDIPEEVSKTDRDNLISIVKYYPPPPMNEMRQSFTV